VAALGWDRWPWRLSGPDRISARLMIAPATKIAADHQNAVV
jgi:hypothetical protein